VGAGSVYSGLTLFDTMAGAVPIQVGLGWRFIPQFYAGVYGQFAPIFRKHDPVTCPDGFTCASEDWRVGVEAEYHFLPSSRFDPYLGGGFGYEVLHSSAAGQVPVSVGITTAMGNASGSAIDRGWEFGSLTLGFDWRVEHWVGIGPYISASVGEYNVHTGTQTVGVGGTQVMSGPVPDVTHEVHALGSIGMRGTFGP
jgi:hypothetical protein